MENFNQTQIINILAKLGVSCSGKFNSRGWMDVLCQMHPDRNFGNAHINEITGITSCLSCGLSYNLYQKVKICRPELSHSEILIFIGQSEDALLVKKSRKGKKNNHKEIKKDELLPHIKRVFRFPSREFTPDEFTYTMERGFTKEFISHHGIRYVTGGYYEGYIAIPIKEIGSFEFRKVDPSIDKKKVLYPKGTKVNTTIWNESELNREEDIYICEGTGGTPKIWTFLSKNVTAIFGAKIMDKQYNILSEFKKRKIFIPDNDAASITMLSDVSDRLSNAWVLPVTMDDKEPGYADEILSIKPVKVAKYLLDHSRLMEFKIV